jgi:hypothetical protein
VRESIRSFTLPHAGCVAASTVQFSSKTRLSTALNNGHVMLVVVALSHHGGGGVRMFLFRARCHVRRYVQHVVNTASSVATEDRIHTMDMAVIEAIIVRSFACRHPSSSGKSSLYTVPTFTLELSYNTKSGHNQAVRPGSDKLIKTVRVMSEH